MAAAFPAIDLATLPEYEKKLLLTLAFFLGREADAQARACLCMYLRQSEPRIMAQVRYYAHQASRQGQPLNDYELMDLIVEAPQNARHLLPDLHPVHQPGSADAFGQDLEESELELE